MFESPAECTALPRCVFQERLHLQFPNFVVHFIQRRDDPLQPRFFAAGGERAGMHHHVWNAQMLGPQQFDGIRFERFLPQRFIRRGQIDEIRIVRQRMRDL